MAAKERYKMLQYLFRFVVGGVIVSAFAAVGGIVKPKSFAGLFGAAPSVALATLGLTIHASGKQFAAAEGRSMIAGALAFCLFAYLARFLLARGRFGAATVSIAGLGIWLVAAIGAWLLVLK
ncbi:MAG TPA: hypothetical protein VIY66_01765 [Candidatus Acidoferrales bacterium]